MKRTFKIFVAVVLITSMIALAWACKKSSSKDGTGTCKTCKAREPISNELVGMDTVCTDGEESAFRAKYQGANITCQ